MLPHLFQALQILTSKAKNGQPTFIKTGLYLKLPMDKPPMVQGQFYGKLTKPMLEDN